MTASGNLEGKPLKTEEQEQQDLVNELKLLVEKINSKAVELVALERITVKFKLVERTTSTDSFPYYLEMSIAKQL
jgi:hypothetical protein